MNSGLHDSMDSLSHVSSLVLRLGLLQILSDALGTRLGLGLCSAIISKLAFIVMFCGHKMTTETQDILPTFQKGRSTTM